MKIGEPFQYRLVMSKRLLICSRSVGQEVGQREPVQIFILLVTNGDMLQEGRVDVKKLYHAAWGVCSVT